MSEIIQSPAIPKGQAVRTWANGYGTWHCEVLVAKVGNAPGVLDTARRAIAEEIRQRGNAATEEFLASERYRVDYLVDGEKTPVGLRYVFREVDPDEAPNGSVTGEQMSQFIRGYVAAKFWADTLLPDGEPDEANVGDWDQLDHWAWLKVIEDCTKFVVTNYQDLLLYAEQIKYDPSEGTPWDYAGHDFALTRNGHGTGFWHRQLEALGDRLSASASTYGEQNFQIGDNGVTGIL
jgi:hypothetical protein